MSGACTHSGDLEVRQYVRGFRKSVVRAGRVVSADPTSGAPIGQGFVRCPACGERVHYPLTGRDRLPAWVRAAIDAVERQEP